MPSLLPGAFLSAIVAALAVIALRWQAGKPALSMVRLILIGLAAAYLIPYSLAFLGMAWRSQDWLPRLPVVTSGQMFIGLWAGFAVLAIANTKANRKRVPFWACVLIGVATAAVLPPTIDALTGSYQRLSLHDDVNHCTRGMMGQVRPTEATNICSEPIVVGLCMPGEVNPEACSQSYTLLPGETATFDPGGATLASLPGNLNGLTVVACRPPARPSRMVTVQGRGHEGVCIPPA
jgi:hypothetical protein